MDSVIDHNGLLDEHLINKKVDEICNKYGIPPYANVDRNGPHESSHVGSSNTVNIDNLCSFDDIQKESFNANEHVYISTRYMVDNSRYNRYLLFIIKLYKYKFFF